MGYTADVQRLRLYADDRKQSGPPAAVVLPHTLFGDVFKEDYHGYRSGILESRTR